MAGKHNAPHGLGTFGAQALKFCNMAFHGAADAPKVNTVMLIACSLDGAIVQRDAAIEALRKLMAIDAMALPDTETMAKWVRSVANAGITLATQPGDSAPHEIKEVN